MIQTSNAYKRDINKDGIRGPLETTADIRVENILFKKIATTTTNGELYYSDSSKLINNIPIEYQSSTLEYNMFPLTGENMIQDPTRFYQGYISEQISDENGEYGADRPVVTIQADDILYDIIGLTIDFDAIRNTCLSSFSVSYYAGNDLVSSVVVTDNTKVSNVQAGGATGVNKIVITANKTDLKYRRTRISGVVFGFRETFHPADIVNLKQTLDISPLSAYVNVGEMNLDVDNRNLLYDPENPSGAFKYFQYGQKTTLEHTYTFETGEKETVNGGVWYLLEQPSVSSENVTFKTSKLIPMLTMKYPFGVYKTEPTSFYDLFEELLNYALRDNLASVASEVTWSIDASLKNYSTMQPLTYEPVNVIMQMLANACNCVITETVDGNIIISPNNTIVSPYTIELSTLYEYPEYLSPLPDLKDVQTSVHTLVPSIESQVDLATIEDELFGDFDYELTYSLSHNQTLTLENCELLSEQYNAHVAFIKLRCSGPFKAVIKGDTIERKTAVRLYEVNNSGNTAAYSNIYITDREHVYRFSQFMAKYLIQNKRFRIKTRGDISLLPQDIVGLDTQFANNLGAMITKIDIANNSGVWSSTMLLNAVTDIPDYFIGEIIADERVII